MCLPLICRMPLIRRSAMVGWKSRAARICRTPLRNQLRTAEAAFMLMWAKLLIVFVPYRSWQGLMGDFTSTHTLSDAVVENRRAVAQGVARHVVRAARHLPFDMVCLPRALATRWMLNRRGIQTRLRIGARPIAGSLGKARVELHAWLMLGDSVVIGFEEQESFIPFERASRLPPQHE